MKIERRIIDDLKTERPDVTPCLPAYFRIVPVLFYLVVLGSIVLSCVFLLLLRSSVEAQQRGTAESTRLTQSLTELQVERESVEDQARRANAIVAWLEGARNIQPLVVSIIRSMDAGSSIAELTLTRDPTTPTQLKLKLKLNTQGMQQLDATLEEIAAHNFRAYNPNEVQAKGEIDYEATLIYQNTASAATTPTPKAQP